RQTSRAAKPANSARRSPKTAIASKCIPDQARFLPLHPLARAPSRTSDNSPARIALPLDASDMCIESPRQRGLSLDLLLKPSSEAVPFHQSKSISRGGYAPFHAFPQAFGQSNISSAPSQTSPRNSSHKRNTSSLRTPMSRPLSPAPRSFRRLDPVPQLPHFFFLHFVRHGLLTAAATASTQATPHTLLPSLRSFHCQLPSPRSASCDSSSSSALRPATPP